MPTAWVVTTEKAMDERIGRAYLNGQRSGALRMAELIRERAGQAFARGGRDELAAILRTLAEDLERAAPEGAPPVDDDEPSPFLDAVPVDGEKEPPDGALALWVLDAEAVRRLAY